MLIPLIYKNKNKNKNKNNNVCGELTSIKFYTLMILLINFIYVTILFLLRTEYGL